MAGLGEWLDMAQTQQPGNPNLDNTGLLAMSQMAPGAVGPWDPNLNTYGMSGMGSFPNMVWPGMSGMGADPVAAPARGMLPMLTPTVKLVLAFAAGAGACWWWCKGGKRGKN
jgi:hypothetical protein